MSKKKILLVAVAVAVVVALVVVMVVASFFSRKSPQSAPPVQPSASSSVTTSASPDASKDSEDNSNDNVTAAPNSSQEAAPAPTTDAVVPGTALRSVHSPTNVTNDMNLTSGQCHIRTVDANAGLFLPDANCTPGAIDPAVTQDNIGSTICKSKYTEGVRATDTDKFKVLSLTQYGIKSAKSTEYDHLISLQLGGTNAVSNLWVEPNRAGAPGTTNPKDAVETKLKVAVCSHKVPLAKAQQAIATDWTTAEKVLGL